jgi:hypothetical protein
MLTVRVTSVQQNADYNWLSSFFCGFIVLLKEEAHKNVHLKESTERDRPGHDALLRCHRVLPLQHSRPRRQHSRGIISLTA